MDRLNQLRGEAGGSRDSTLDTSSPPSETFMTANESSSKYFSLSEVDSTFDISSIKDVSLASANTESEKISESDQLIPNLSPIGKKDFMDGYKIGKQIEAANILSGGVNIFDDNDNSYDGDELVIDDNAEIDEKSNPDLKLEEAPEATLVEADAVPSKDTEVILQIDGKNVDAIDIGNGLYLYRKEGQEELAAVQIIDDDQHQPSFKFLKVRENAEGNLEVYEEIQIEVPNEVPVKEEKVVNKSVSHVPIKDINKVINDSTSNKITEKKPKTQNVTQPAVTVAKEPEKEPSKEVQVETKSESSKKNTFSESRKSPVIGSFTPMTFHSTPNKEGIPLTKTMVDLQLHPSRHSDNIKKTIEVHTDSAKQRTLDSPSKTKDAIQDDKTKPVLAEKDNLGDKNSVLEIGLQGKDLTKTIVEADIIADDKNVEEGQLVIDEQVHEIEDKTESNVEKKVDDVEILEDKTVALEQDKTVVLVGDKTPVPVDGKPPVSTRVLPTSVEDNTPVLVEDKTPLLVEDKAAALAENKAAVLAEDKTLVLAEDKTPVLTEDKTLVLAKDKTPVIHYENISQSPDKENKVNTSETKGDKITEKNLGSAAENKLPKVIDQDKLPLEDSIKSEKQLEKVLPKSKVKAVEKIVDDLIIKSTDSSKNAIVAKVDSNVESSLKIVDFKEIVMKNDQSKIGDEVDSSKKCTDNIQTNQKSKNIIDAIQDQDKKEEKKILNVTTENAYKESKVVIVNNIENNLPTDTNKQNVTGTTIKPSKEDQKPAKPDTVDTKIISSTSTGANEKVDKKPAIQTQNEVVDTQKNKESKDVNPTPVSKTDLAVPGNNSKTETKVQSPNIENEHKDVKPQDIKPVHKTTTTTQNLPQNKSDSADKKVIPKTVTNTESKLINNNHAAVPFGKWTDVNRQAFLNRIKESKVPTNSSNGKQIKNSNDLNRRDVLKKIDSQRQSSIASAKAQELKIENQRQSRINSAKTQDFGSATRMGVKKEAALANKPPAPQESRLAVKTEPPILKNSAPPTKKPKQETIVKPQVETVSSSAADMKKDSKHRKEINNQDLIDKTIEGIINRPIPSKTVQEAQAQRSYDEIEMKMNELHGKPFVERPMHELPTAQKNVPKTYPKSEYIKTNSSKTSKIPNLLPFSKNQQKSIKENTTENDSEEEVIIEHEPITGDMDLDKSKAPKLVIVEKVPISETLTLTSVDGTKKETIITEKDFDKFARRNSISYENCITVNFDGKETHNVIQSLVQKDVGFKTYSKAEPVLHNPKVISPRKRDVFSSNSIPKTTQNTKFGSTITEDDGKNYQSKVKMAYQTAMTAKRQLERPITIIEDRPVKVVYMDTNSEFISNQLNVQGKELSPAKKPLSSDVSIPTDSQDSDNTLDSIEGEKMIDDTKTKTKHQRKQVLTPVETPELELIEPDDLGIEVSPKKKRKTEEKPEKNTKTLVPKKSYLLGRGHTSEDSSSKTFDFNTTSQRDPPSQDSSQVSHKNTASAIDSLVKAAELLETQSGNMPTKAPDTPSSDSQQNTPVKRGRGRPRKYPLPEGTPDKNKVPSPQKKPRLIDAKIVKSKDTDGDDSSTDDEVIVKENWTMGKINENIVCPICKKLFRSENVVFKHVKHCTGPSPSRSDSENKSPRRYRESQESESRSYESKSEDMDLDESDSSYKEVRTKRKSKDTDHKTMNKGDIIVIEDTPLKSKPNKREEVKPTEARKITKNKAQVPEKATSLVCEFCGKTFRQLSYLVSHKLQHGKEDLKKAESEPAKTSRSVFGCEVCKKEFRYLHHLAQHRLIHNPSNTYAKLSRKSSSEQNDNKVSKEPNPSKPNEDTSAGFRCEPCDKSFRKLHHLVEHRETHDGINRQKSTSTVQHNNAEKLPPPPQCEICKKTFRKLHHLIEHKEQHLETSSEKSDDKSIKSSLSTRDIIHECSLCYMVFPNESALNKHTINCQKKKRQSTTKQMKQSGQNEIVEEVTEASKIDENKAEIVDDDVTIVADEPVHGENPAKEVSKAEVKDDIENKTEIVEELVKPPAPPVVHQLTESLKANDESEKKENKPIEPIKPNPPKAEVTTDKTVKVKKPDEKESKPKVHDTPKKKTPLKEKVAPTVTKRHKPNLPLPDVEAEAPQPVESSDDDEARYMLNPDYKFEDSEGKVFMKVRANKRNSLQIERPNSKDLVTRRISLQHPLKVPRLKAKAIQNKIAPSNLATLKKTVTKATKPEPVPSTDSEDSDVKYSFPKNAPDKVTRSNPPETSTKEPEKKIPRKSLAEKRKSLSSIAKRKSLGKAVGAKHKVKPSPLKQVRKRTAEVEHRCDCGQLFSSAALLSRHTSLAHTPPRVRRRRSPPPGKPEPEPEPEPEPPARKAGLPVAKPPSPAPKPTAASQARPTKRKSTGVRADPRTPPDARKSLRAPERTDPKAPAGKPRRYAAHKGVPVPEKMRKLMEKSKK